LHPRIGETAAAVVLRLNHITFVCADPQRLSEFWNALLDGDDGPELFFRKGEKTPTIELPIHLDVNVPDREAEAQRILELGGKLVETKSHQIGDISEIWTVMRDPEGNGFCIQTPPKTERRYIGNVTFSCAEPVALGKFYAEALGWPDEGIDDAFMQQLLDAGMDPYETTAYYATRETPTSRPRFLFQRREKSRPMSYPIHLEFRTNDADGEIGRLELLGARFQEEKSEEDRRWVIMLDSEGNPFWVE
jgi:predicted enzyme related to lactoylglutathione lyase